MSSERVSHGGIGVFIYVTSLLLREIVVCQVMPRQGFVPALRVRLRYVRPRSWCPLFPQAMSLCTRFLWHTLNAAWPLSNGMSSSMFHLMQHGSSQAFPLMGVIDSWSRFLYSLSGKAQSTTRVLKWALDQGRSIGRTTPGLGARPSLTRPLGGSFPTQLMGLSPLRIPRLGPPRSGEDPLTWIINFYNLKQWIQAHKIW